MATVPVYGGPQIKDEALRPVYQGNVDVSSGLQSVARGVAQAGDALDGLARRQAETEINAVDEQISAGWLQWKAENGRKFQGENAPAFAKAAEEWWAKAPTQFGADKASPLAGRAIGQNYARKRSQALAGVSEYVNAEGERFADSKAEAAALREVEWGIDTGDTAAAAARVRAINAQKAARKGWTADMLEVENQRVIGAMHLSRIEQLAETDAAAASAYYNDERVKKEIPLTVQNRVEKVLKAEGDNQFAVQFAAERGMKPLEEQRAEAAAITDPERRKKTLTEIQNNFALKKAAQQEREQEASDQAWQLVGQGKRVPETLLARMDGKGRVQLQDHVRDKAKQAAEGTPVKTDWATYIDARERLANGENVNLQALTTKIGPAQLEQLLDVKTQIKAPGKQDAILTDEQRLNTALTAIGIDKKRDPEAAGLFAQEIDRRVRTESAARGGKDLTADEKQKIIDAVSLDKVYVDSWGPDGAAKPVTLVKPDDLKNAYVNVDGRNVKVSSVPMQDRQQIIAALKASGRTPTEQSIVELYLRGKNKQAASGTVK